MDTDLVSVIIPLFNEEENVEPLCEALGPALQNLGRAYEVIFVDDGSSDGTAEALAAQAKEDAAYKVISFKRNVGQTPAMMAGIDHAKGSVIVPMDGDLQNDPTDIAKLLDKLDEGYGVVSGWRQDRKESFFHTGTAVAHRQCADLLGVGCAVERLRLHLESLSQRRAGGFLPLR